MFYRQKIALALLQEFGGKIEAIDFQKYLFLFCKICQSEPVYEFVPYKYGCFSFQSYADKRKMIEKGIIADSKNWELLNCNTSFFDQIKSGDRNKIRKFKAKFENLKGNDLIQYTYEKYPYWAINSEIVDKILSKENQQNLKESHPSNTQKKLYTIGYEGRSFEHYLNQLIINDVRVVCDVRKNPLSRKYGFSKGVLSETLNKLGIGYIHFPKLGIPSNFRRELSGLNDYKALFLDYEQEVLQKQISELKKLISLLDDQKRIALTCFEADIEYCHRNRIALQLQSMTEFSASEVAHI